MADEKQKEMVKVKEFKLRQGFSHSQDGHSVKEGDSVYLTETQARAFRDRFMVVDDGDFKQMDAEEAKYDPDKGESAQPKSKGAKEETGPTKDAPQGQPPPQPPIHVEMPRIEGPADINTLDPAKQGQQSREQREIIDSGEAPLAAIYRNEEERKKALAGNETEGKKSTGAPAGATASTKA
jgi:hypothetical protein